MAKLATKWNMSKAQLNLLVSILALLITIFGFLLTITWAASKKFTQLERDAEINIEQHNQIISKVDTTAIIAKKAFENSKLLDIKKIDKPIIKPEELPEVSTLVPNLYQDLVSQ